MSQKRNTSILLNYKGVNVDRLEKKTQSTLKEVGARLERQRRHVIYKLPDGRIFVCAKTPSDWRASRRSFTELQRLIKSVFPDESETLLRVGESDVIREADRRFRRSSREASEKDSAFRLQFPHNGSLVNPNGNMDSKRNLFFSDLQQLLEIASFNEAFWKLDHSGRIRVLYKFAEKFAAVAVLAVRFSCFEMMKMPDGMSREELIAALNRGNFNLAWLKQKKEWAFSGVPALLVNDPVLGQVVLDVGGMSRVNNSQDFVVMPAKFDDEGTFFTNWPLWDIEDVPANTKELPRRLIAYTFFNRSGMQKWGISFATSSSWTDERMTKKVRNEMLATLRDLCGDANCES